jgi:IclR family transcriptional regulator, KDG regulon repressor
MRGTTRSRGGTQVSEPYQVRAVLRAMDLLDCFTPAEPEFNLAQLAERAHLCTSTTFRLLQTLEARRYVEQAPQTGRYRLGVACLRLGETAIVQLDLRDRLRALLLDLRNEYRETVHLAILDYHRMEVIYVDKLDGLLPIGMMSSRVGARAPAHCTGIGKALLAFAEPDVVVAHYRDYPLRAYTPRTITDLNGLLEHLAEIRRQGYALDNVEHEPDVKCVAVPVYDHTRVVACAVSISGPEARMDKHIAEQQLIERMLTLAQDASSQLGYSGGV